MLVCSTNVLLINVLLRERNSCDGIFFLFTNSSIFLFFLTYHLKCLILTPCITKRNHVCKYHLIFFFCNFIIDFFLFRRCPRKELLYERSRTNTLFFLPLINKLLHNWYSFFNLSFRRIEL